MTDTHPEVWARLDELMALKPGWLDGEGVPPGPAVAARVAALINFLSIWASPVRIYPTPEGGIKVEWDDGNLDHSIVIRPDLRLNLQTIDREEHQ
ncbi:hypothetical protein ACPC54_23730 [Kitasatospora sp. NPDC094028]